MADETKPTPTAKPAKGMAENSSPNDGPAMAGLPGEIIKVRGPEDGRWRGGLQFGPVECEVDLSTLTLDALAEIEADTYLSVTRS